MIKSKLLILILWIGIALLVGACGANENLTPTAPAIVQEPINPLPQITPATATLITTPTATIQPTDEPTSTASPTETETQLPSETPTATPTEGPWEYTIRQNDTLISIIQQEPFNYRNTDVIREIIRINDNIFNADILPPPGQVILIPRPTITPTPQNNSGVTVNNPAATMPPMRPSVNLAPWEVVGREGPVVNVLVPTPTTTLTPTPSGLETPTMTPTFNAPALVSPPNGGIAAGLVTLQWVSVGVLRPEEQYLVQVVDNTSGTTWTGSTKQTALLLPESLVPNDGQPHLITWTVSVAQINNDNTYSIVGVTGQSRSFTWQSR